MKLQFNVSGKTQPDPFIFPDKNGKYYIYNTGINGIHAYSANALTDEWKYEGIILTMPRGDEYWAPSMIYYQDKYYLYFSYHVPGMFEHMHVACAETPLGPFTNVTRLYKRFTIDSHVVETAEGLFLWYAEDNLDCDRIGTRIFVDKLIDPYTPANICKEVIVPTMDEEITGERDGKAWHTVEGPFWFREGEWQYVMYSAGAFTDDTYHVGYACAKTNEEDLTKVDFVKMPADGSFSPVMFRNEAEECVGHHSVIKIGGEYYAVYHARDRRENAEESDEYVEARTARFCKLHVKDGVITSEAI